MFKKCFSKFFCNDILVVPRWLIVFALVLIFLGLINAGYLVFDHFNYENESVCPIVVNGYGSCHDVTRSQYSEIFGVPLSVLGFVYYLIVFILFLILDKKSYKNILNILFLVTSIGLIFSIVLVYIQIWILRAICPYCMFSAVISVMLTIIDILIFKLSKKVKF